MRVDASSRRGLALGNLIFYLLLCGVVGALGYLSTRYELTMDWTATGRNTLSAPTLALLEKLDTPVSITAFAREDQLLRDQISELVARYQHQRADISLRFINPDTEPQQVRDLGIQVEGELLVEANGRAENVRELSEEKLSNAIQTVSRRAERWLVFLEGHGERSPTSTANHDLSELGEQLRRRGFHVQGLNLAASHAIPDNTTALVVASPQVALLPGELTILRQYLRDGGRLMWLTEPNAAHGFATLSDVSGVALTPGVIVDPTTQMLGIAEVDFPLVTHYPAHPITESFDLLTLFPTAVGIDTSALKPDWTATPLLTTAAHAWSETGELKGEITRDGDDSPGPLDIGVLLTRSMASTDEATTDERQQRLVVVGDGDFLANQYLGNGGNLDLGLSLFNWLAGDDQLLAIPAQSATDTRFAGGETDLVIIGAGHLFVIPGLLLLAGIGIWVRRRRR